MGATKTLNLWQRTDKIIGLLTDELGVDTDLCENGHYHAIRVLKHCDQNMDGFDSLVLVVCPDLLGVLNGLLGLEGKLIEVHVLPPVR